MFKKKSFILGTLVGVIFAYYLELNFTPEGKTIETKSGAIRGTISMSRDGREFYEWLGIPYAKPPVGKLRFATPEPVEKWTGIRDGHNYGPLCVQITILSKKIIIGDEDCLYLNIHTPKLLHDEKKLPETEKQLLPVLVYIHAGGFILGGPHFFRPEYFMDEDVVVVSIHYRLHIFGFLSTGDKAIRGNMGLKDQILALKWIQENIQSFGGDPNKVTIFGHSAGAASVHHQLLSSKSKGLFRKAISLSGVATTKWSFKNPEKCIEKSKVLAKGLNCPTDDSEKLADCLRKASVRDLLESIWDDTLNIPILNPHKIVDMTTPTIELVDDEEAFLTQHPLEIVVQGKAQRVPWMVGITSDEGLISMSRLLADEKSLEEFENNMEECIKSVFTIDSSTNISSSEKAQQIREFYLPPSLRSTLSHKQKLEIYSKIFGDGFFVFDIRESISYQRQFSSVYPYFYSKTDGPSLTDFLNIANSRRLTISIEMLAYSIKTVVSHLFFGMEPPESDAGVNHLEDAFMMFPCYPFLQVPTSSKHYQFSKDYVKLLVDFASGNDESALAFRGVPFVPTSKTGPLKFLEITNDNPRVTTEPFGDRMKFLQSLKIRDFVPGKKFAKPIEYNGSY